MIRLYTLAFLLSLGVCMYPPSAVPPQLRHVYQTLSMFDTDYEPNKADSVEFEIDGLGTVIGGVRTTATSRRPIYSFFGLPYGHDTSGSARFKESSMYETPWLLPMRLKRIKLSDACPQESFFVPFVGPRGQEDCLKLFIHTTKKPGDEGFGDLPVMVWFHGGGYIWGDHNVYRGKRLLDEADMVLVMVHYRLGVLGAFCTHSDEAPGNAGLSDQVLALEYIQKYIHNFGGDPSKVVISGESAGAGSVSHLMLYDGASALFRGVIAQSGSALEGWGLDHAPIKHALEFGTRVGCNFTESGLDSLVECVRQVPMEQLIKAQTESMGYYLYNQGTGFEGVTPVVQKAGNKRIVTQNPNDKLRSGNFNPVPVIYGSNLNEGSFMFYVMKFGYMDPRGLTDNPDYWMYDAVNTFLKQSGVDDDNNGASEAMTEIYYPGVEMTSLENCVAGSVDMMGVMAFRSGSHQTADMVQRAGAPAYSYSFEFDILQNIQEILGTNFTLPVPIGVTHALELPYLYAIFPLFTENMKSLSRKMVKLWTNFVIELNPTPESQQAELEEMGIPMWPSYTAASKPYMKIDKTFQINEDITQTWTDMMQQKLKKKL